jgi:hypothetical protein
MKRTAITTALALAVMVSPAWPPTTAAAAERLAGYEAGGGNVVGGGLAAAIVGGGEDMAVLYAGPGAGGGGVGWSQAGRTARFATTDGDGPRIEYGASPATPSRSGREAWLLGGGEDAQVVYGPPRR